MVLGLIVVPIVSLVTPKMDTRKIEAIFTCLEEQVVVDKKIALPKNNK